MNYYPSVDCEEAQKYLSELYDDPMTDEYGIGGEVAEGWLRKHVRTCERCRDATHEGNTP